MDAAFSDGAGVGRSAALACWSGLGYNRRAVFLQNACKAVCNEHGGVFPTTQKALQALPGIGSYTAGAVATFAYDQPNVFIETNIRSVYIHTFFAPDGAVAAAGGNNAANVDAVSQSADGIAAAAGIHGAVSAVDSALSAAGTLLQPAASTFPTSGKIDDKDIAALVEQTLDRTNPREWYYALMDYGAMLKKQTVNPSRRSRQYAKQSRFEGSFRQARGAILRQLSQRQHATLAEIALHEHIDLARLSSAAEKLVAEKLVTACDGVYRIAD